MTRAIAEMPVTHPAAELFPMMTDAERKSLVDDIRKNGLVEPVIMFGPRLLDGRNRWKACIEAGVEVRVRDWNGPDPVSYVRSLNLHRRHLTPSQRAALAVKVEPVYAEAAEKKTRGTRKGGAETAPAKRDEAGRSLAQAAKSTGASLDSAKKMKQVAQTAPEVVELVQRGQVTTVADAKRVAELPVEQRTEVVEMIRDGSRVTEAIERTKPSTPMERIVKEATALCKHASSAASASGRLVELCRLAGASISGLELAVAKSQLLTSRSKITQVLNAMEARDEVQD